ncbi:MazG nucleotide pyrophosphohydrolase domain-containing protein [Isobaculum melis]|uniref:Tetrapyrrole methylase family protein / MazG family protein n=1 Tax=Isobaculum melis TaxID=142588 RepID=A0A1H9SMK2_9LACT|nr:MazG nucleotide pyrophosphohydrolase domain-containing protein [Isobaculum melis]SER86171.1 tetrapyrrole methylase family protein / MazG family protein [Isobaculum melis]
MGKITIVGLGAGDMSQLPMGVYQLLQSNQPIYLRTKLHPVVTQLAEEGLIMASFDAIYEQNQQFDGVYEQVVKELLQLAEQQDIIYAVPGHPMVAEKTVQLLLKEQQQITVEIAGGQSFLDDFFTAVKIDPIEGFQLLDALALNGDQLQMSQHLIIMQVFDAFVASDVKLLLTEKYPDDHQVALVHEAGSANEVVEWKPLYEIDRMEGVHNLTSLYVPPLPLDERTTEFATLQSYMDEITGPTGDIWIREQNNQSLVPYLEEETAELIAAIEKDDIDNMVEELGDILMQVMYHASIGEKEGMFTFEEMLATLNKKLRRRHPHVFDGVTINSIAELDQLWQKIKETEKRKHQ